MPTSASQRENRILRISSWKFRCQRNHRPLCASQIRQKADFSCNPRVRLGKKPTFPTIRASDWTKSRVLMQSTAQIGRKAEFFRFPHVRLGKKPSFHAIRTADWAKSRVFMLSARQIRRKVECSCNPRDRRLPHLMDFLCSVRHISAVQTAGRPQRAAISQHIWPHCKPPQLSGRCACFLCKSETWG